MIKEAELIDATVLASLSPEQRALFDLLRQGLPPTKPEDAPISELLIRPHPVELTPLPLSFAQQRFLFIDRFLADRSATFLRVIQIDGAFDRAVAERAFQEIVQRHEILRTTVALAQDEYQQIIHPIDQFTLPFIDLQPLLSPNASTKEHDAIIQQQIDRAAQMKLDLTTDWPIAVNVLRITPKHHILLLVLHYFAADGISARLILDEFATCYRAFLTGTSTQKSNLPPLSLQYADFALWQRQWIKSVAYKQQLFYWQTHLDGAPLALNLPTDHPRPTRQSYRGDKLAFEIDAQLAEALHTLSRQAEVTLFTLLLTLVKLLLYHYTAQSDLVVGIVASGRPHHALEKALGNFANHLPVRTDLAGHSSFGELLQRVHKATQGAFANQEIPIETLLSELRIPRTTDRAPLYQVTFALHQHAPLPEIPDLSLRIAPSESDIAQFDLSIAIVRSGTSLSGTVQYNTDLFDPSTIYRFCADFQQLGRTVTTDPDGRLSTLVQPIGPHQLSTPSVGQLSKSVTQSDGQTEEAQLPPRTPIETILAEIWCERLARNRIGIHDNFFALGGHSLTAMQVTTRINQTFHIEIPIYLLFEFPTIAELAVQIVQQLQQ